MKLNAAFAFAASLSMSHAHTVEYKVRVRNLTYMQPFSPPLVVAHTQDVALFKEGLPPSDALQTMAEDGDNSGLLELAGLPEVSPFICGAAVADAPLFPGETVRLSLEVDPHICPDAVYSLVGMLINTNDAFVGVDSLSLGSSKAYAPAFDAGTETNNEMCDSIPGPACDEDSGNVADGEGEGYVHIHRGVHGVGDITESVYDWRNPVAEIFIAEQ